MTSLRVVGSSIAGVVVVGVVVAFAVAWRPAITAIDPPAAQSFDPGLVKRGRELVALGNCNTCHTMRGGENFAGGVAVPTPFGAIYSSNITPDAETGIGRWSETAFRRAMKSGVNREGQHLYPTFPYDHFTRVSDEDDRAIYAYLMTREPVHAPPRGNGLSFPFNQRFLVAAWKLLFLRNGTFEVDNTQSAEWNRGAYLVEGLAHCGSCHTPRNALGAEQSGAQFSGANVENWHAYAVNPQSPAPVPWTREALSAYLRNGWHPDHGIARGPMAEVVSNLSSVPEGDVRAIANYMTGILGEPSADRKSRGNEALARAAASGAAPQIAATASADASGAALYAAACAACHEATRPPPYGGINLNLNSGIGGPDPRNIANTILGGIRPIEGERSPIMPGFAASMSDNQLVSLLRYLRARFSRQPAWDNLEKIVQDARRAQMVSLQTEPNSDNAPADLMQRGKP